VPAVIEALKNDPSVKIRQRAVSLLDDWRDERAIEPLIEAAMNDPSSEIRNRAIRVLGDYDDPRAKEALLKFLQKK
jgi:HEAT repeat protein